MSVRSMNGTDPLSLCEISSLDSRQFAMAGFEPTKADPCDSQGNHYPARGDVK